MSQGMEEDVIDRFCDCEKDGLCLKSMNGSHTYNGSRGSLTYADKDVGKG
jgi:hypothetical protein